MLKFVSVIIPCRNEAQFIAKCLDCVLEQDYPRARMEILVAEGGSADGTRKILESYTKSFPLVRWFDNPGKTSPCGLNILIRQARGEIIIRLDAHARYPQNYISKCVGYLIETGADNVGGVCVTLPGADTLTARAISLALSCRFGMGDALFRTGVNVPTSVDTVPFGCFRRGVFDKVGLFDEDLVRSQDCELNHRIIKNGGKIVLIPEIISYYYARENFQKLATSYAQYGYFKAFTAVKLGGVFTVRQFIPGIFVGSLWVLLTLSCVYPFFFWIFLCDLAAYALADILFSARSALKNGVRMFPLLFVAFFLIHVSYGYNYLRGVLDFWVLKKHTGRKITDMPLTR